ncbi:MAG: hypothetical protein NZ841_07460 [Dictyoglomus sp.]|nr:hypothetical protein [Dictyoglomus sp.]MCX7941951.1 hypothetical protein [Dictyoglomaceae bacterium]MDW8189115.1 hypothetical protein [Dictyoglomus sp.]
MRYFKIFLLILLFVFISGCARTVTSPLKKVVEVSFTLEFNLEEGRYLVVAFNKEKQPTTTDLSTWKNFILFKVDDKRFYRGKNGNLDNLSLPYFECTVDSELKNFNLKIPLSQLYEDGVEPEKLHINIFYFYYEEENIIFEKYLLSDIAMNIERGFNRDYLGQSNFISSINLKFY